MKLRLLLILGATLLPAAAADAATTGSYVNGSQPHTLTLTNDGTSETFNVQVTYQSSAPTGYKYVITATSGPITVPAGANCTGNNTLVVTCNPTATFSQYVQKVVINGGDNNDAFTINAGCCYDYLPEGGLRIDGQNGDDTFTAAPGTSLRPSILGGADNDTFNGSADEGDQFLAEPGNDTYNGGTAPAPEPPDPDGDPDTYQFRSAPDSWTATAPDAVNVSLDGTANDADGLGGTDNVKDVEYLNGGAAGDTLSAGSAAIKMYGGGGDDTLTGSPLADELNGEEGSDQVRGNDGDDSLFDGDRTPQYRLAADPAPTVGNDRLDGGPGDDTLGAGDGVDDVVGGAGNDAVHYGRLETQVLAAAPGPDFRVKYRPMTVSLDDQANDGPTGAAEGDNLHADLESVDTTKIAGGMLWAVRGSLGRAPRLMAISVGEAVADDSVSGSAGSNVIRTGDGNDTVDGGAGPDIVEVGRGNDTVNAVDQTTDIIACGRGADSVGADLPGTNAPRADSLSDCETVTGTPLGLEGGVLPVAPTVTLGGAKTVKVKKFLRTYTVAGDVTSDQPASVSGELTLTGARIAKVGALSIGSGKLKTGTGKRRLKVKVAVKYRKALKRKLRTKKQRRKGLKLALVVTVRNAAGQTTTSTRTIRIKG